MNISKLLGVFRYNLLKCFTNTEFTDVKEKKNYYSYIY